MKKIESILKELNPDYSEFTNYIAEKIENINQHTSSRTSHFNENQTILITYPDQFKEEGHSPLKSLKHFVEEELEGLVSHVHLLPFYPWSSDDGFGPNNYHEVNPDYGSWDDIKSMKTGKMFDCVFNHLSSQSEFFQKALSGDKESMDMFHFFPESEYQKNSFQNDIKNVVRPRTTPLMTPYKVGKDQYYVWTTFSADQVDTNINNKKMVKYILDSFFLYLENGATFFRIDAVPFLWKELGTNSSHHPKTHLFVQLLRAITDEVNKDILIITESNVPHIENISYFGNGKNEAHLVYNFSLAPLILHSLVFKNNHWVNNWSHEVFEIAEETSFINFTATHDGIGMRGLEGIVPDEHIFKLCQITEENEGVVGKKRSRSGEIRPYELNITWASFLQALEKRPEYLKSLIINSHALAMFYPGIGANYVHNFFGTFNCLKSRESTGIPRRVNRKKFSYPMKLDEFERACFDGLKNWIKIKTKTKAFHPKASFEIIETNPSVIAFRRSYQGETREVYFNLESTDISTKAKILAPYELWINDECS